jgi:uncharacterized protein YaaW (UPF0174 family)
MFALKYKPDPGLEFLQLCSHEEIKSLADILISTGGSSEEISSNDEFIKNKDDLKKSWQIIAAELQKFGGNTILNATRIGRGIYYEEIVDDACKSLGIIPEKMSTIEKEENILSVSLRRSFTVADISKLLQEKLYQPDSSIGDISEFYEFIKKDTLIAYELSISSIESIMKFAETHESRKRSYKPPKHKGSGDVLRYITRAITDLAITAVVVGVNQADPAFRVTIPAIIQIGYLRRVALNKNTL